MMRLSLLVLLSICLMAPVIFAQSPDYLPVNSDHWYQDLNNPNVRLHRYSGSEETHHIEYWENEMMQWHTVWGQTRDAE